MRKILAQCALWMADRSGESHTFWNDLAEALTTHQTLNQVRASRVGGPD